MVRFKAFKYRIYPTRYQVESLYRWEDSLRWLWNLALEQRLHCLGRPKCDRIYLTAFDQMSELTELLELEEFAWLRAVPRNDLDFVLKELDIAWQRCFKKLAKAPNFKKKYRDTMGITEPHPKYFEVLENSIKFPKCYQRPKAPKGKKKTKGEPKIPVRSKRTSTGHLKERQRSVPLNVMWTNGMLQ